jgi:hypothetical protein
MLEQFRLYVYVISGKKMFKMLLLSWLGLHDFWYEKNGIGSDGWKKLSSLSNLISIGKIIELFKQKDLICSFIIYSKTRCRSDELDKVVKIVSYLCGQGPVAHWGLVKKTFSYLSQNCHTKFYDRPNFIKNEEVRGCNGWNNVVVVVIVIAKGPRDHLRSGNSYSIFKIPGTRRPLTCQLQFTVRTTLRSSRWESALDEINFGFLLVFSYNKILLHVV